MSASLQSLMAQVPHTISSYSTVLQSRTTEEDGEGFVCISLTNQPVTFLGMRIHDVALAE